MRIVESLNGFFRNFEYRQPRVHTHFPVWLQFHSPQNCLVTAVCVDISENGMGIDTEQAFEPGSRATLIIPSERRPEPYLIPVRIVSRQGQRHGCRFVPARPDDVREIAAALAAVGHGSRQSDEAKLLDLDEERKAV